MTGVSLRPAVDRLAPEDPPLEEEEEELPLPIASYRYNTGVHTGI